jgi:hypothetical protein
MSGAAIDRINDMAEAALLIELRRCCASERWAGAVVVARPFAGTDELIGAADAAFNTLTDDDWKQAFAASADPDLHTTDDGTRDAIAVALRLYQERFGYPFVIGTEHVSGDELLMRVRIRLGLEEAAQMRATRYEQFRLTRARLQRMIDRLSA